MGTLGTASPMVEFDFEGFVSKILPEIENADTESLSNPFGAFKGDPKHRTVVCKHWLLGLCQNGATCGYLHRLDRSKMYPCKHGTSCKIKNCFLKHSDETEVIECIFFKQGFCCNGPECVRRHLKRLPDQIPKESTFEQCITVPGQTPGTFTTKKRKGPNENYKVSLCNHWLLNGACHFNEECHFAHGEEEIQEGIQTDVLNDTDVFDPTRYRMDAPLQLPFSPKDRISYFLFQAPDLRSLSISKRRGVWSVPTKLAPEINASIRAYDHVVAFMLVRPLKGLYGVVRINSAIPSTQFSTQPLMTPEFNVSWLRTMRVCLRTIAQLKIGSTGAFVGRTTTDSKFESKVGSEIMYISFRKPEWDWSQEGQFAAAEEALVKQRLEHGEPLVASYMPPDVLFASDWVEKALQIPGTGKPFNQSVGPTAAAPPAMPDFYTLDHPGFIFNLSSPIVEEAFHRSIFGLPPQMKDISIAIGAPLFVFDPHMTVLVGLFQATTVLTENLEAQAFIDWSNPATRMKPASAVSMLPWQLRFSVVIECPPIPLQDPDLLRIFAEQGGAVPAGGVIGLKETKALANLFAIRSGIVSTGPTIRRVPGRPEGIVISVYKPPFSCVEVVPIDVPGSAFDVKRRVLGYNGSFIKEIVQEVGGAQRSVRIRIRGIGSGFYELGASLELQEPLHFNVSAETEEILRMAVTRVKDLINKAKNEVS